MCPFIVTAGKPRIAALTLALCMALSGCGKTLKPQSTEEAAPAGAGASAQATRNTTRLGGATPADDAAAVARAVYPSITASSRPQAVVFVSESEWPAALAASVFAGGALKAPLLYSHGIVLAQASARALETLRPTGSAALGGAQAIRVGEAAAPPELRLRSLSGREPAELAVAVERLAGEIDKRAPRAVIVTSAQAPPAMTAPAAGLSALTGAPILFVERSAIPAATARELARLGQTSIYVLGPASVVGDAVVSRLGRYGPVTRVGAGDPVSNAIALARFSDGSFGWGIHEPGHGLVFAGAARPFDGPAAAPLSTSGDYGPLLLLDGGGRVAPALRAYLQDLQPGSPPSGPVKGVYNHGWLIGDTSAISAATQTQLDTMLEISPQATGTEPAISEPSSPSEP